MIYKSEFIDLREVAGGRNNKQDSCGLIFARNPADPGLTKFLDTDGLPFQGLQVVNL
jgi:hypothetical protein